MGSTGLGRDYSEGVGMSVDIDTDLCQAWLDAKAAEAEAIQARREAEDRLLSLLGIPESLDGTENTEAPGYKIKVIGRMTKKVDADKLQEIAAEHGLEDHLQNLFRWKAEINKKAWESADGVITGPLSDAITTKPGRASVTITKEAE